MLQQALLVSREPVHSSVTSLHAKLSAVTLLVCAREPRQKKYITCERRYCIEQGLASWPGPGHKVYWNVATLTHSPVLHGVLWCYSSRAEYWQQRPNGLRSLKYLSGPLEKKFFDSCIEERTGLAWGREDWSWWPLPESAYYNNWMNLAKSLYLIKPDLRIIIIAHTVIVRIKTIISCCIFRSCPLRMWLCTSPEKSGTNLTGLKRTSTEMWCWRITETWSCWVMTQLKDLALSALSVYTSPQSLFCNSKIRKSSENQKYFHNSFGCKTQHEVIWWQNLISSYRKLFIILIFPTLSSYLFFSIRNVIVFD